LKKVKIAQRWIGPYLTKKIIHEQIGQKLQSIQQADLKSLLTRQIQKSQMKTKRKGNA
jgi:hypothetical protein